MQCVSPIRLSSGQFVPCGRCFACLRNRQRFWAFRLEQVKQKADFILWLLYTYNDENLPKDEEGQNCFRKTDVQKHFKRLRKKFPDLQFKYFLCSEYSPDLLRPHYHCVLFGNFKESYKGRTIAEPGKVFRFIHQDWSNLGFVFRTNFHGGVFKYVSKYCCKPDLIGKEMNEKPFILCSKGLGLEFLDRYTAKELYDRNFIVDNGVSKMRLTRYYRDKLFPTHIDENMPMDVVRQRQYNKFKLDLLQAKTRKESEKRELLKQKKYESAHPQGEFPYETFVHAQQEQIYNEFINSLKNRKNGKKGI